MVRVFALLSLVIVVAAGSVGCCSSCSKCGGGGRAGYWRNWGLPGKHPVGKACCRGCDLCDDVGGPCGGWAKTGAASPDGEYNGVETDVIYEDQLPPTTQMVPHRGGGVRVTVPPQTARTVRRSNSQY